MKKTAMQLLIEDVKRMEQGLNVEELSAYVYKRATELLETERQDHERTYTDAFVNSDGMRLKVDFEQYYKDTYQ